MAGIIRVDVAAMEEAARSCRNLAERIEQCRLDCGTLNETLQVCYEGQSARAFDEFCKERAMPTLREVSFMCSEIARGIDHTCSEFTSADGALSGTFQR